MASKSLLSFFTPSEATFKPLPYTPKLATQNHVTHQSANTTAYASTQSTSRTTQQTTSYRKENLAAKTSDHSSDDANSVIIRHPWTSFPNSEDHPSGLTFALLSSNPNWFLNRDDFIGEKAVSYPSQLEPPRGWNPLQKQRLAMGECSQATLRCTFCDRHYAGVNAKSMWRRHVFEKHKVAMSNRREGAGRFSNKENQKEQRGRQRRSSLTEEEDDDASFQLPAVTSAPRAPRVKELLNETSLQLEPSISEPELCGIHEQKTLALSPPPAQPKVSDASPYNPLRTPAFRHSPPRLPSDQPWRFSSVFGARDISLAQLVGSSSPFQSTPFRGIHMLSDNALSFSPTRMPSTVFDTSGDSSRDIDALTLMTPPTSKVARLPLFGISSWTQNSSPTTSPVARKRGYEGNGLLARPFKFKRSHTSVDIFSSTNLLGDHEQEHHILDSSPIAPPPLKRRRTVGIDGASGHLVDIFLQHPPKKPSES